MVRGEFHHLEMVLPKPQVLAFVSKLTFEVLKELMGILDPHAIRLSTSSVNHNYYNGIDWP